MIESNLEIRSPPTWSILPLESAVEKVSMDKKIAYTTESANVNVEMETHTASGMLSWE